MIDLEDIYPLSPMQKGMVFHALLHPENGVYVEQFCCKLRDALQVEAFQQAWQYAVDRHAVLRTSFNWEQLDRPLQLVHRRVEVPWDIQDLRGLSEGDGQRRLESYLEADRRRGFQLQQPPLMRLALLRVDENTHYWLWSHHHVLLDGWSSPLLLSEVFTCYEVFARGLQPQLSPARPYREFIAWLQRQDLARAESYWREALHGIRAPIELQLERQPGNAPVSEPDYAVETLRLSEDTTRRLQTLALQRRLTLHTLVQGAWAILLGRYSGTNDVLFGTTVSGRSPEIAGVEEMIGLFINTLPTRVQLPENERLPSWLERLQAQQAEARQYDYTPLSDIQAWSDVSRGTPLFETIFVFENYPMDRALSEPRQGVQRAGLKICNFRTFERTNYPLTAVVRLGRELELRLAYETQRFNATAIRRLLDHWRTLLEAMSADPGQRVRDLPLLTVAERHTLLVDWNQSSAEPSPLGCVHELFQAQAARFPTSIAVLAGEQQLTYGQLDHQANDLADRLRRAGVGPDVLVGVCLERAPMLLVALLAVLKAGGAYMPLDPAYPMERLAQLLDDAQAALLLTQARPRERLPSYRARVLFLDGTAETAPAEAAPEASAKCCPDQLAYVIYTSGSTGRPKGVAVQHGHLVASTWARLHYYDEANASADQPQRRFLLLSSYAFDSSVAGIFGTLCQGGCLIVPPEGTEREPAQVIEWIVRHGITDTLCVPSLYELLLTQARPGQLASLRRVVVAGEECPPALVRHHQQLLPETRLFNEYGPTEATVWSTVQECSDLETSSRVPIGRAIANAQVYVLDHSLNPVPVGVPGELYIGGLGVARGYLHQPELTAERFLPDPFSDVPGARVYRTGDRARWRADGSLEFLGRIDQQIKLRGFRIEPGEIEAVLLEHPAVRDCTITAHADEMGQRRLVAYVVCSKGGAASPADLRGYLGSKLPDYLVPAIYVFLDALPLTTSGKLDRRALPNPTMTRATCAEPFAAAVGPLEGVLADIWSEVLRVKQVGRHDDYFALGGDSLLSLRIISRIRETFQVQLPLQALFDQPTVAALAEALRREMPKAEQVAETVLSLASLSDAEVEAMLAARTA
jgi:amino acid adenylation domain-containing protein